MSTPEEIKGNVPAALPFIQSFGLQPGRSSKYDKACCLCPAHSEKHPSCDVTTKDGELVWKCRSCGAGGDSISFAAAVWGMNEKRDFGALLKRFAGHVGAPFDQARPTKPRLRLVKPDPIETLAKRIDTLAASWLGGKDEPFDQAVQDAAPLDIAAAMRLLDQQDQAALLARERAERLEEIADALDVIVDSRNDGDPQEVQEALIERLKSSGATQTQVDAAWKVLEARWLLDAELDAMADAVIAEADERHGRMRRET